MFRFTNTYIYYTTICGSKYGYDHKISVRKPMHEKQRHIVQSSNNSHISPDSNYVLSETTLVMTFPTCTFLSIVWDNPGSDRSIMCYHNKFSLGHSSNTNLFACIVRGETWFRPSTKLRCQYYVIYYWCGFY